jgi:hypothetical protein
MRRPVRLPARCAARRPCGKDQAPPHRQPPGSSRRPHDRGCHQTVLSVISCSTSVTAVSIPGRRWVSARRRAQHSRYPTSRRSLPTAALTRSAERPSGGRLLLERREDGDKRCWSVAGDHVVRGDLVVAPMGGGLRVVGGVPEGVAPRGVAAVGGGFDVGQAEGLSLEGRPQSHWFGEASDGVGDASFGLPAGLVGIVIGALRRWRQPVGAEYEGARTIATR